ncbi:MAG: MBOAT family protein [Fibrobacteres bacterium]|nr:MBOAT family protein [Fibrobacterota bacterium]
MLFNSAQFILFFVIVTSMYFLVPHRFRWMWLLSASCYFYMAFIPKYILILGFTILVDYVGAIALDRAVRMRKTLFAGLIAINVGVLIFYKYYEFLLKGIQAVFDKMHQPTPLPHLDIILPIGLSFHTFQAMSYLFEVYYKRQKPERHFGIYSLFVMFYPQLVAGPIERPQNLLHQFWERHHFSADRFSAGLRLMLWGLFKKVVVADRLAVYVDAVYGNPSYHNSSTLALATVFLAFQIYADFSGYSDIAIGSARVMGFDLMTNFRRPYFAQNFAEFWGRWHISLSSWFRDYVYIPLGGSRAGSWRKIRNILLVFGLSGLWHGAALKFCIWGIIHGVCRVMEDLPQMIKKTVEVSKQGPRYSLTRNLQIFVFVCIAWVFFRAANFSTALLILKKMASLDLGIPFYDSPQDLIFPILGLVILIASDLREEFFPSRFLAFNHPMNIVRWTSYSLIIMLILLIGVLHGGQFIYFQF